MSLSKFSFLSVLFFALSLNSYGQTDLKKIYFIGTGGTIAGIAPKPTDPDYDAGKATLSAILSAAPEIRDWAEISGEQLKDSSGQYVNVPSNYITEKNWIDLAIKANWALTAGGFDAVIVTHGTDTLEETAFFLHLSNQTQKPILLVGAYRPSNHPAADGPDNIRAAVKVAISDGARGLGAAVVMDRKVYSAIDVAKMNKFDQMIGLEEGFAAPYFGSLATVDSSSLSVVWDKNNKLLVPGYVPMTTKFDVSQLTELAKVPVLNVNVGNETADLIEMYIQKGVMNFVIEGNGGGAYTKDVNNLITRLGEAKSPAVFVRASRVPRYIDLRRVTSLPNSLGGGGFRPAKAKILLQLLNASADSAGLAGAERKEFLEREYQTFGVYMDSPAK